MPEDERKAVLAVAAMAKRLAIWGAAKHWLAREKGMLANRWTWTNDEPMLDSAQQKLLELTLQVRGRGIRGARSASWPQNSERGRTAEASQAEDVNFRMRRDLFGYGLLLRQPEWCATAELLPENLRVVLAGNGPSVWIDIVVKKNGKTKAQLLGSDWEGKTQPWDSSGSSEMDQATRLGLEACARAAYRTAVLEIEEQMRQMSTTAP